MRGSSIWRFSLILAGAGALVTLDPPPVVAQERPFNVAVPIERLSQTFGRLYGPNGLIVDSVQVLTDGSTHSAHFTGDFQSSFSQFGAALASQLAATPLPSPASGVTFEFDPQLGVFERSTQSFGSILGDRADTIGAGRFSFGFTFQRFSFDSLEGLDTDRIPAVFVHDSAELLGGREDVITTINSISTRVNQFTTFITYGLTDSFDISLAVPVVSTDLTVVSNATVQRIGTVSEDIHFFRQADGSIGDQRTFTAFGSAAGPGDLTLRIRGRAGQNFGLGVDLRIPTGDEENFLAVGAPGIRPFFIVSGSAGRFSPHVNFGYTWNGSSLLAGDVATGTTSKLPDQANLLVGADLGVSDRFTFAFDLIGTYIIDATRLKSSEFVARDGTSTFADIDFVSSSYEQLAGAVGFKASLVQGLLLDMNLLFSLDDNGLRDRVTPLVGLEYSF